MILEFGLSDSIYSRLSMGYTICIFDITRTNLSHVWLSGSDQALPFPGRLCAYTFSCLLDLSGYTIRIRWWNFRSSAPPLDEKKVILAPDQHNQPDLCFRIWTLREHIAISHSFMLKLLTVVPTLAVPHIVGTFITSFYRSPKLLRQWFVLMMVTNAIRIEMFYCSNNIRVAALHSLWHRVHTTSGQLRKMFPKLSSM
jgi:hypothetical protein